jgi:hypothetical protein
MAMKHPSEFDEESRKDFYAFVVSIRDTVSNENATKAHRLHCVQMLAFLCHILGPPPVPSGPGGEEAPTEIGVVVPFHEYRKAA